MGWRIIQVNSEDNLKLYLNNLLIKRLDKKILINIQDIDVLLLDNYKINLSIKLINSLVKNNVIIITFDTLHEPSSYIFNIQGNHNSLKIFNNQIKWTNTYKGNMWQEIIRNKIYNQISHLTYQQKSFDKMILFTLMENVKKFDVSNREGHAAKLYWHNLFGIKFKRDQNALENSIINSMLNYGYTILRGMLIKGIIKKGLDSRLSLFHRTYTNFFALASDLMEPFRPIIDMVVYKYKDSEIFKYEIKEDLIKSMTTQVIINGKLQYLNNAIDMCINNIISGNGWLWVDIWK